MPRKGHIQKRDVLADPIYKNKGGYQSLSTTLCLMVRRGCSSEDRIWSICQVSKTERCIEKYLKRL